MQLGDMYPAVLTLVLVGIILGVGIVVLDEFGGSGIGASAQTAISYP